MILKIKYNTKKIWKSSPEPFVLGEERKKRRRKTKRLGEAQSRNSIIQFRMKLCVEF